MKTLLKEGYSLIDDLMFGDKESAVKKLLSKEHEKSLLVVYYFTAYSRMPMWEEDLADSDVVAALENTRAKYKSLYVTKEAQTRIKWVQTTTVSAWAQTMNAWETQANSIMHNWDVTGTPAVYRPVVA